MMSPPLNTLVITAGPPKPAKFAEPDKHRLHHHCGCADVNHIDGKAMFFEQPCFLGDDEGDAVETERAVGEGNFGQFLGVRLLLDE